MKENTGNRYGRRFLCALTVLSLVVPSALADEASSPSVWYLNVDAGLNSYGPTTNMMYWSSGDGTAHESTDGLIEGDRYIVRNGRRFTANNQLGYEFPGESLVIGDSEGATTGSLYLRGKQAVFNVLELKRGTVTHGIYRSSSAAIHEYSNLYGEIRVTASRDEPFYFTSGYQNLWMAMAGNLVGEADAGFSIGNGASGATNILVSITNAASYFGDLVVTSQHENVGRAFGYGLALDGPMPGSVRAYKGTIVRAFDAASVTDIGSLSLGEGAGMRFVYDPDAESAGHIRVTGSLSLPEKVVVCGDSGSGVIGYSRARDGWEPVASTTGEEVRCPFLTGPAGVRIDPGIFEFEPDPRFEPMQKQGVYPQRLHFEVETDEATGRDTVYAVVEPIVELTKSQSSQREIAKATPYGTAFTNASYWSDNRVPHEKAHYVSSLPLNTPMDDEDWEFPGYSYLSYGGVLHLFGKHRIVIPEYHAAAGMRQCQGASVTICGGKYRVYGDYVNLRAYAGSTLTIESEITGDGNLHLIGEGGTSSPHGFFAFTGMNTNWFGTMDVTAPNNPSQDDWAKDFLTVRMYDGRNLGGRLPEMDYRAFSLGRLCELYAHTNVTLDASANRGIFIAHEAGARLTVDEGYTLECNWPITMDGPLYKTEPGTLALGGGVKFLEVSDGVTNISDALPDDPAKRLVVVTNGTLKALSHDCVNGLTIAMAENQETFLALDADPEDEDLERYGFYNVRTDTPFAAGNEINVRIDGADADAIRAAGGCRIGLVTVKTTAADSLGLDSLIKFHGPFASGVPRVRLVREDDEDTELTTYCAYCDFTGFRFMVR